MGRCADSFYRRCASEDTSSVQPSLWPVFVPCMHCDCGMTTTKLLLQLRNLFASGLLSGYTWSLREES